MIKLIKNVLLFILIFLVVGEVLVRLKNSVSDIPQREIDEYGIQKYYPNQHGTWKGGTHTWIINKLGWAGKLPTSYDNLVTIIGDSYIENFMNPDKCRQAVYLKKKLPDFNFVEAGRSGVSFIESMEISKQFYGMKPVNNLIYVKDNDFYQSLVEIRPEKDITQFNLKTNSVVFGEMKSPGLKKILYNWKFAYFLYSKSSILDVFRGKQVNYRKTFEANLADNNDKVYKLLEYVKMNYAIDKITLVFHPNSNKDIIAECQKIGFKTVLLNSENDKSWSFVNDQHWTCYGHEKVAEQVSQALMENKLTD